MLRLRPALLAAALVMGAADAEARNERYVIVDLTATPPALVVVPSSAPSFPKNIAASCASTDGHKPEEIQAAIVCLRPSSNLRWVSTRDDRLHLYVIYRGARSPRFRFIEESRKTRLATDLGKLLRLAKGLLEAGRADSAALNCVSAGYVLERKRANLTVSVQQEAPAQAGPVLEGGTGSADGPSEQPSASAIIVTGPSEHYFLSADLPFKRFNELKLNEQTGLVEPVKSPTSFFVGLGYALGDLLSEGGGWRDDLVIKGSIKFDKQPLESYGVALGYRGALLSSLGLNFDAVSPFAGYFWTRGTLPAGSPPGAKIERKGTFQMGFSFNLDAALGWTKGDGK